MSEKRFIAVIILLFLLANAARWGFRERVAQPRFAAEGAAHFRYTELVARGEAIPALDAMAQWPEGLSVFRETAIGMEYVYGLLYRLLPGSKPDLDEFLRFCVPFLFSLAIVPLALLSAKLWESRSCGALTALLFAVALPLVARSSGFELIRENLTLPLLAFHLYFLVSACGGTLWRDAVLSAVFLSLGMATWQGTQFYLVPLLLFLVVRRVLDSASAGERRCAAAAVAAVLVTGALVPFLRAGGFLLSVPTALSAAWIGAELLPAGRGVGGRALAARSGAAAAGFACVLAAGLMAGGHFLSYSHFFNLIFYKLRYLHKPADPRLLPFDARAFWVGPFHSPDARHLFVFALPMLLLLPNPAARLVRRARGGDFAATFAALFLLLSLALFLLMQRLLPLFGVFAVVAAGGGAIDFVSSVRGRRVPGPALFVAAFAIGVFMLQDFAWEGRYDLWRRAARLVRAPHRSSFVIFPSERDVEGRMLDWIGRNTATASVVMSLHYLSPQVLTYTGRMTNLNDFFESPRLRRKAERLLTLLYGPEEDLLAFCREQGSDYLLVSAAVGCDPTLDSPLYQAGLTDMPPGCAAYRLLFEPGRLAGFNLVYENEMYRLFRVGEPPERRWWPRSPLFYERELLWKNGGDIALFYETVMRVYALTARGKELERMGRPGEAERALAQAIRIFYFYPGWRALADIYRSGGRLQELESICEFGYQSDPNRPDVCLELAEIRLELGGKDVEQLIERCLRLPLSAEERGRVEALQRRLSRSE